MAWLIGNDLKNDWMAGGSGADTMKGLGGNDTLKGGGGADWIDGGAGIDSAIYADSSTGVTVNLTSGKGEFGTAQGDTLVSIENVYGSAYSDWLIGNSESNLLSGGDGNDYLDGRAGDDLLDGGYGNDMMWSGAGRDTLNGGDGIDTVVYNDSSVGVVVSLITDVAAGGTAEGDDLNSIENVYGSDYSDTLIGDDGRNVLWSFNGNDTLKGYGGDDQLYGYDDNDALQGMEGNDDLWGGTGNDTLDGGSGADRMGGSDGADTFLWRSIHDLGLTQTTCDVVRDFNRAEGDRLDLSGVDANVYAAGDQAFTFIGTAAFSGTPGEINYYYDGGNTYVQLQTGTSADIEGLIRFDGIVTPEASWFYL